jgi:TonB family protein
MRAIPDDLKSWTPRQRGGMVVALVVGQLALILVFAERDAPRGRQAATDRGLRVVGWPAEVADVTRQLGVSDPVVFALPNARGFSGAAWRRPSMLTPPRVEWSEPPRWLGGESKWFGQHLPTTASALLAPRHPLGRPAPAVTSFTVRSLPVAQATRLELDAGLQSRGLSVQPDLPAIPHTNLLDATVLRVAVEPDGSVFSAVVVRSSGWEGADQQALGLMKRLKFTPESDSARPSNGHQWGSVHVRWHATPPDLTGAPPGPGP